MKKLIKNKFFFLFWGIIVSANCCQFSGDHDLGITKVFYPSGKIMSISKKINDSLQYTEVYYETGELHKKFSSINGEFHGKTQIYYENGKLSAEVNYYNGKIDGVEKTYYKNGLAEAIVSYVKGVKFGEKIVFHPNGNIRQMVVFHDDLVKYTKDYIYSSESFEELLSSKENIGVILNLKDTFQANDNMKWTFKVPKVDSTKFDYSKFFVKYGFIDQSSSYDERGLPAPSFKLPLIDGSRVEEGVAEETGNFYIYGSLNYELKGRDTTLSTFKQKFTIIEMKNLE